MFATKPLKKRMVKTYNPRESNTIARAHSENPMNPLFNIFIFLHKGNYHVVFKQ